MPTLLLFIITAIGLSAPWWIYSIAAVGYALWRPSYVLFAIAFIIDAVYGIGVAPVPVFYTLITAVIVTGTELLKPYVRYYN